MPLKTIIQFFKGRSGASKGVKVANSPFIPPPPQFPEPAFLNLYRKRTTRADKDIYTPAPVPRPRPKRSSAVHVSSSSKMDKSPPALRERVAGPGPTAPLDRPIFTAPLPAHLPTPTSVVQFATPAAPLTFTSDLPFRPLSPPPRPPARNAFRTAPSGDLRSTATKEKEEKLGKEEAASLQSFVRALRENVQQCESAMSFDGPRERTTSKVYERPDLVHPSLSDITEEATPQSSLSSLADMEIFGSRDGNDVDHDDDDDSDDDDLTYQDVTITQARLVKLPSTKALRITVAPRDTEIRAIAVQSPQIPEVQPSAMDQVAPAVHRNALSQVPELRPDPRVSYAPVSAARKQSTPVHTPLRKSSAPSFSLDCLPDRARTPRGTPNARREPEAAARVREVADELMNRTPSSSRGGSPALGMSSGPARRVFSSSASRSHTPSLPTTPSSRQIHEPCSSPSSPVGTPAPVSCIVAPVPRTPTFQPMAIGRGAGSRLSQWLDDNDKQHIPILRHQRVSSASMSSQRSSTSVSSTTPITPGQSQEHGYWQQEQDQLQDISNSYPRLFEVQREREDSEEEEIRMKDSRSLPTKKHYRARSPPPVRPAAPPPSSFPSFYAPSLPQTLPPQLQASNGHARAKSPMPECVALSRPLLDEVDLTEMTVSCGPLDPVATESEIYDAGPLLASTYYTQCSRCVQESFVTYSHCLKSPQLRDYSSLWLESVYS